MQFPFFLIHCMEIFEVLYFVFWIQNYEFVFESQSRPRAIACRKSIIIFIKLKFFFSLIMAFSAFRYVYQLSMFFKFSRKYGRYFLLFYLRITSVSGPMQKFRSGKTKRFRRIRRTQTDGIRAWTNLGKEK
jgi:hypothetical protein